MYIDRGDEVQNKNIFDHLHAHKEAIEHAFGGPLSWERLDAKRASGIKKVIELGGYRSPESHWPEIQAEMVNMMSRLERALAPELANLGLKV